MTKPFIVSSSKKPSFAERDAARRAERSAASFRAYMGFDSSAKSTTSTAAAKKKTKTINVEELSEAECAEIIRKIQKKAAKHAALAAIEIAQAAERSARLAGREERAVHTSNVERKLRLVPGAIHKQARTDRKAAEHAAVSAAVFDGVAPSVIRALRMGGLNDLQIASIVLGQKCG